MKTILIALMLLPLVGCVSMDNPDSESAKQSFLETTELSTLEAMYSNTGSKGDDGNKNKFTGLEDRLGEELTRSVKILGYGKVEVTPQTMPLRRLNFEKTAFKERLSEEEKDNRKTKELATPTLNFFRLLYSGHYCSEEEAKFWSGEAISSGKSYPLTFVFAAKNKTVTTIDYSIYVTHTCGFLVTSEKFPWENGFEMRLESRASDEPHIFNLKWRIKK